MPRVTNAPASRKRRKRILKQASGFYGARSKLIKQAREAVERAMCLATEHRKLKKREYRSLWISRLSAACRQNGITYNRFIEGLVFAHVKLNRKVLSEIAVNDPQGFVAIVEAAKKGLSSKGNVA
jgi:large subunit ribosomal protein L20